jgi:hypothetical protein
MIEEFEFKFLGVWWHLTISDNEGFEVYSVKGNPISIYFRFFYSKERGLRIRKDPEIGIANAEGVCKSHKIIPIVGIRHVDYKDYK